MTTQTVHNEAPATLGPRLAPSAWLDIPQALLADLQAVIDLFPDLKLRCAWLPTGENGFSMLAPDGSRLDIGLFDAGLMIFGHESVYGFTTCAFMSKTGVAETIKGIVRAAKDRLKPMPAHRVLF